MAASRAVTDGRMDPDLPIDCETGIVYHLACTRKDLADRFIFVGDPARVEVVAARFDAGSIIFSGSHREIAITTGTYKGVPVTCLSTGMGTDNVEIVINEIHALKEYDVATRQWMSEEESKVAASKVRIIRVGTCGSPQKDAVCGQLAITRHCIGMDNTCRYYTIPAADAAGAALSKIVNEEGPFSRVGGAYTTNAHPDITKALVTTAEALESKRKIAVGITATGSGFYGCQGRVVGRFKNHVSIPNLVDFLGTVSLPIEGEQVPEQVVNIEMETSAVCCLSNMLGYKAGTVCAVLAKRAGDVVEFATPEEGKAAINDAINVGLDAVVSME